VVGGLFSLSLPVLCAFSYYHLTTMAAKFSRLPNIMGSIAHPHSFNFMNLFYLLWMSYST